MMVRLFPNLKEGTKALENKKNKVSTSQCFQKQGGLMGQVTHLNSLYENLLTEAFILNPEHNLPLYRAPSAVTTLSLLIVENLSLWSLVCFRGFRSWGVG